jgi:hypothetical protein
MIENKAGLFIAFRIQSCSEICGDSIGDIVSTNLETTSRRLVVVDVSSLREVNIQNGDVS